MSGIKVLEKHNICKPDYIVFMMFVGFCAYSVLLIFGK